MYTAYLEPLEGSCVWAPDGHALAFLVRTTPTVLAILALADVALRSVADVPATLLQGAGALAPASCTAEGTLLFVAPTPRTTRHSPRRQSSHARR